MAGKSLTVYSPELARSICERIAAGETLRAICKDEGMPAPSTVSGWVVDDRDGFAEIYDRANQARAWMIASEVLEIADDGTNDFMERKRKNGEIATEPNQENIQRSKLRVDTRMKLLAKLLPEKFGEKVELSGKGGQPLAPVINVYCASGTFVPPSS